MTYLRMSDLLGKSCADTKQRADQRASPDRKDAELHVFCETEAMHATTERGLSFRL
jgi:hypothetical protein